MEKKPTSSTLMELLETYEKLELDVDEENVRTAPSTASLEAVREYVSYAVGKLENAASYTLDDRGERKLAKRALTRAMCSNAIAVAMLYARAIDRNEPDDAKLLTLVSAMVKFGADLRLQVELQVL